MTGIEIGICVAFYVIALIVYILRKQRWKKQEKFIIYKGKHAFRINDVVPFVIIIFLILSFQVTSFSWIGFLCIIPFAFMCVVMVINYNGFGKTGVLHFSDLYLFEDIEVYYIGEINGKYYVNVKGKPSRFLHNKRKSIDSDVAELVVEKEDVEAISKLFEANVSSEKHSEYPIYKRVPK